MAKAKKKSEPKLVIPPHPAVASAKEMGAMCAEIYGYAIKVARQDGLDEQQVEQLALGKIQRFMAACIKQSKELEGLHQGNRCAGCLQRSQKAG